MTNAEPEVIVDSDDHVLIITVNRPLQKNAMTQSAGRLIASALDELDKYEDLHVGIITGAGGTFCSGLDLKRFAAGEIASVPERGFGGLTERPPQKPLIAAVEGYAVGGGFEMVLACDLVVASTSAKFGLPEVRRGLAAKAGGLIRLPERLPRAIAMEVILTGDFLTAERAASFGLVNVVVPDGQALERAKSLATAISSNAPLALLASKRVFSQYQSWPVAERYTRQAEELNSLFFSEDAREGALAFAEKRPPVWKGR
jgi:enoyl-CoA hydratase